MVFGIDYQAAVPIERSGIGTYIYNLVKAISQIDKENDYKLFVSHAEVLNRDIPKNFHYIRKKNPLQRIFRLDSFHGPDFKLISVRTDKKIVTIHDLASRIDGDFMSDEFRLLTRKKIERSIAKADIIVTVSKTIKNQLEEYYPETRGKIRVVYHGVNEDINETIMDISQNDIHKKYNITTPYLLYVGNLETRKNLITLIKSFQIFVKEKNVPHHLVLVGKPGWGYEKIKTVVSELKCRDKIHFVGWISNEDISVLYSHADLFVYPSWYEGFGFPLVEAMKCGVPVVASDILTHREIAGAAALFISPSDVDGFAKCFSEIISNRAERDRLIQIGKLHSQHFSWRKTAHTMLEIYRE
jgi:glycosyltransferase involved in cell wall biosynthesis